MGFSWSYTGALCTTYIGIKLICPLNLFMYGAKLLNNSYSFNDELLINIFKSIVSESSIFF